MIAEDGCFNNSEGLLKEGCDLAHVPNLKDCGCIILFSSEISLRPKEIN